MNDLRNSSCPGGEDQIRCHIQIQKADNICREKCREERLIQRLRPEKE